MLSRFTPFSLLAAVLFLTGGVAVAQPVPAPLPQGPSPTGVVHWVKVNGEIRENRRHQFHEDGTWEMWDESTGEAVGWGVWEQDPVTGDIDYVNHSGDGGGNQTGTYSWNPETAEWDRTAASHPDAPKLSLVPPL